MCLASMHGHIKKLWLLTLGRNNQIFTLPVQDVWRIVDHIFPSKTLALVYAFVNSHRTKVGMPRADVHTLTIPYIVITPSECAPDDFVAGDYNKK